MKLNRLLLFISALTVAASCSKSADEFDQAIAPAHITELKATLPAQTRIAFENNLGDDCLGTIDLSWEDNDTFTVSGGDLASDAVFTYDSAKDIFESEATLTAGEEYVATYDNGVAEIKQNGPDNMEHLRDAAVLKSTFTYGEDETLNFEHTQSFLCLVINDSFKPTKLKYDDGTSEVNIKIVEGAKGENKVYFPIAPISGEREINVVVTDPKGVAYTFTKSVSKAYEVGKAYQGKLTLTQKIPELTINVTEITFPAKGGGEFVVDVEFEGGGYWEVLKPFGVAYTDKNGKYYGSYTYPKFTESDQLTFSYTDENSTAVIKEIGEVKFEVNGSDEIAAKIDVYQAAAEPYITLEKNVIDAPWEGGKFSTHLDCLKGAEWYCKEPAYIADNWHYHNGSNGYGPTKGSYSGDPITFTIEENTDEAPRSTSYTFYLVDDPEITTTLTINQAGYVYVPPTDVEILRAAYDMTSDWNTKKDTGWKLTDDDALNKLYGVTTDEDGDNVVEIEVTGATITGDMVLNNLLSLEKLNLYFNRIESLDVSGCEKLRNLNIDNNKIGSINLEGCVALEELLICNNSGSNNHISEIDLTAQTELTTLSLSYHDIEELDLSNNPNISSLTIKECENLKKIIFAGDSVPAEFDCGGYGPFVYSNDKGWGEQDAEKYPAPNHIDGWQYPELEFKKDVPQRF